MTATSDAAQSGGAVNLDDIPPLTLGVLTSRADKVDALQLVADSVAQQRQVASRSLVFHPLSVGGLVVALGVAYQTNRHRDYGTLMMLLSSVTMTYFLGIRYFCGPYLTLAEGIKWDWLKPGGSDGADDSDSTEEEDTIIGAKFGEEIIGALVLRFEPPSSEQQGAASANGSASGTAVAAPPSRKKQGGGRANGNTGKNSLKGYHGVIRAWTTKLRYRRRGIGGDLLQEAVRVTRERCGKDAIIGFAQEHANSKMVVPEMYNGPFRKAERVAAQTLNKILASQDPSKRRR